MLQTDAGKVPHNIMTDSTPSNSLHRRVLSGMRPTGKLHLGNYMGALYNWVRLQNQYECFFFVADWHALTTDYADLTNLRQNILDVTLDWLGAGLDPERATIFLQSWVPQHAELHLLLSMITPLGWLERVPSYKEQQENLVGKDLSTYGFLGYPLLQSADILVYQADFVPVGQDQVTHVELTREVARRFNNFYPGGVPDSAGRRTRTGGVTSARLESPAKTEVLPEPQVLLTPSPKVPGTDGRK
ncbi:MAG: tryptophan--tRNA ligase, partial [Acetobacteraceae bacterium]